MVNFNFIHQEECNGQFDDLPDDHWPSWSLQNQSELSSAVQLSLSTLAHGVYKEYEAVKVCTVWRYVPCGSMISLIIAKLSNFHCAYFHAMQSMQFSKCWSMYHVKVCRPSWIKILDRCIPAQALLFSAKLSNFYCFMPGLCNFWSLQSREC